MSLDVNQVMLVGNLGADPEIRRLDEQKQVARLSVATSEQWRDKDSGERVKKTIWHRVSVFSPGLIDKVIIPYCKKGTTVLVMGQLHYSHWQDNEAIHRTSCEIKVSASSHLVRPFGTKNQMTPVLESEGEVA